MCSSARSASRAFLSLILLIGGCTTDRQPETDPRDPALSTLERLERAALTEGKPAGGSASLASCLSQVDPQGRLCPLAGSPPRTLSLRLALDSRYSRHWQDGASRLRQTLACVNTLYRETGIQWQFAMITPWDPGTDRHNLYALLDRLQRELPSDLRSLTLGITLWEERKIYSMAGGEIGLSQGTACLVPSWPRVENDCLILAHELGHLVGAKHVPGKQWIMGWAARPFHLPAADPVARVTATYRFHPRNSHAIRAHRLARFTEGGLRLPPGCARWLEQVDRCWGLDGS